MQWNKDTEVKRENTWILIIITQWVKSRVVPACCIGDRQQWHRERLLYVEDGCFHSYFIVGIAVFPQACMFMQKNVELVSDHKYLRC